MKRWVVALSVVALVALVWLATAGGLGRSDRPTPRAEGSAANRGASSEGASGAEAVPAPAPLPPPVDLDAVDRDRDLHGIVVRKADGVPIAGAVLQVVTYPWRRANVLYYDTHSKTVEGPSTLSASDGTFSLRLRPGADVSLQVRADGYATRELAARQAGERVRVEMDPGVRLTIATCDERGNPVPGTGLRLFRAEVPEIRGVTDERGRCLFGAVPCPAIYTVDVVPERLGYHGWETVQLIEPGEREHVVTLVEGGTITGRVIDAETGTAIPNARIGMNWVMVPFVLSGADGRYALPGWLGKGMDDIHCVADGYGRAQCVVSGDVQDFELQRGDTVIGRLLRADGQPVPAAAVSIVGSTHTREGGQAICTRAGLSDAAGRFLLSGLRRDMPHTLIAMADGHGRYLLDFDPHPKEPGTIDLGDISLPDARTIAGRVLSHDGEAVPRIEVNLSGANSDRARLRGGTAVVHSYGAVESRHTDDLGRFRFADLSPGSYKLGLRRPVPSKAAPLSLDLAEKDVLDIEVVLPDGRELTVTVVDEAGAPVPAAFVSTADATGRTDAMGRATLFVTGKVTRIEASPGASGRDLLRADVPFEGDADEFRLVLRKAAKITGTILGEDGKPFAQAAVAAKRDGKEVASATAGLDGAFSLVVPPDEYYDIEFTGVASRRGANKREEFVSEPVHARAGATGVELRVKPIARDRALRVRVVFPDGTPAAGVRVFADRSNATTGADGVAMFSGLPAKEIPVNAGAPLDRPDLAVPVRASVVPASQEVTLTLRKALAVTGVVVMPDGTPAAGAFVMAQRADRMTYAVEAAPDGTFTVPIPAEEAGPWTVQAWPRDKKVKGEVKDVRTGDAGVRIQLK